MNHPSGWSKARVPQSEESTPVEHKLVRAGASEELTLMNSAESMVSMINLLMQGNIGRI